MKLPISFEEVSYFKNEFRGDLIITTGILYYFPHTRVNYARHKEELGGSEALVIFDLLGYLNPLFNVFPWLHTAAGKSLKAGKFLKRSFRPTINTPRIRERQLWRGNETNSSLQNSLDSFIEKTKKERLDFEEDSVPKPLRFTSAEIQNARLGMKFRFDAKYDDHDFKVNVLHRRLFRKSLVEGGFLNE